MSLGHYLAGVFLAGGTVAAAVLGGLLVVRGFLGQLSGAARWTAAGLLMAAFYVGAHLLAGVLGLLTAGAVLAISLAGLAACFALVRGRGGLRPRSETAPISPVSLGRDFVGICAVVMLVVAGAYAAATLFSAAPHPIFAYDQLGFKLPNIARWIQRQSVWGYDLFLPRMNTGSYPQNGDLVILGSILPWHNDAFVRFAQAPFWALTALATYGAGRELGARRADAGIASILFVSIPVVTVTAFSDALPDTVMLATFASGVLFLLRHDRTGARSDLVLAGLGLGLAAGTKWYGVEAAVVVLGGWFVVRPLLRRRSMAQAGRALAIGAGVAALAGGFWFVRNAIETGNPFYPARFEPFGIPILPAPPDLEQPIYGLSIGHYLGDWSALRDQIIPGIARTFRWPGLLLGITAFGALLLGWRERATRVGSVLLSLTLISVVLVGVYVITPYSAQGFHNDPTFTSVNTRWVVPAVLLWAVAAPIAFGRLSPRWRAVLAALAVLATVEALHEALSPSRLSLVAFGLAGILVAALLYGRATGYLRRPSPAVAGVIAAAIVGVLIAGGEVDQRDFNRGRYIGSDPTFDWVLRHKGPLRVGLAGDWNGVGLQPVWPMFGDKLDNRVAYIGRIAAGRLVPYAHRSAWRAAIARRRVQTLLVGHLPHLVGSAQDRRWARQEHWPVLAESRRFTLYQVPLGEHGPGVMSAFEYFVGAVYFGATLGALGVATAAIHGRWLPDHRGAVRVVSWGLVMTALLILALLVPGILGVLTRGSALLCALAIAAATVWLARRGTHESRAPKQPGGDPESPPPVDATLVIGLASVAIVSIYFLASVGSQAAIPTGSLDALTFHLPSLGRWIQSESLWHVDQFIPLVPTGYYPQNGNLVELAAVLPWRSDFLFRLVDPPYFALLGVAVYGMARELRAGIGISAALAAAVLAMPAVTAPALYSSIPDVILLAAFSGGILFLIRYERSRALPDLALAGVGLGVAFGTKWYGVTSVGVVVGAWVLVSLVRRHPRAARRGLMLAGLVALFGGFWLLRNAVASGNPLYPARLSLGVTTFDAPPDARGGAISSLAHYAGDLSVWRHYLLPGLARSVAAPGLMLLVAAVAAVIVAVLARARGRRSTRSGVGLALGLAAAALAITYAVTPSTAPGPVGRPVDVAVNARYLVPAIVVAAGATAWLASRLRAGRVWLALALALATVDGLRRGDLPSARWIAVAVAALALVAGGLLYAQRRRPLRLPLRAGLATVCLVAAGGLLVERHFEAAGYGGRPTVDWILDHAPSGKRIGIAGSFGIDAAPPIRAAFGPRFGNRVQYVGPVRDGELRLASHRGEFDRLLRKAGYDYLLVGRGRGELAIKTPDARWARQAGFTAVVRDARIVLLRSPS